MNLPNKITVGRFFAIPLFLLALIYYNRSGRQSFYFAALFIFALAAISDGLDGYIARSRNMKTKLGAVLDPIADKLLLNSAIILLAYGIGDLYQIPIWFAVLVVSRDLLIVGGALVIRWFKGDLQVKPCWWGKIAAVLQMGMVIWVLIKLPRPEIILTATIFFLIASGISYLRDGVRQLEH